MNTSSITPRRRQRRSAKQWQIIVNEYDQSALTAKQFCAEKGIGYPHLLCSLNFNHLYPPD